MNITQAKALFFAQYWGQDVMKDKDCIGHNYQFNINGDAFKYNLIDDEGESYLLLRTVEQLTDMEVQQIAKFAHQMPKTTFEIKRDNDIVHAQHTDRYGITSHISIYKNYGSINSNVHFEKTETEKFTTYKANIGEINKSSTLPVPYIAICDYLRALGILIQFTYLNEENKPVTLSPDEIVKMGWCVIKK